MPVLRNHTRKEGFGGIRINNESIGEIFPKYFERLVYFANQYLNDKEKACDAVHEMFLVLWEKRNVIEFNDEKQLKTYLYLVTKAKAVDYVRKSEKEETELGHLTYREKGGHHDEEIDNQMIRADALATIRQAIADLPPQCRSVMELLLEGKSPEEISWQLEMRPESVRKNKSLGVIALRKRLNRHVLLSLALLIFGLHEIHLIKPI
jgi:RNA polymerase sigma-70 factor (ECF subfamily)